MKDGVIFARVSSRTQELEGFSLDAQVKLLTEYCERKEIGIKRVFQISETASRNSERKKFTECLEYVKRHKISCLVIEKVDRLTRNYYDHNLIDEWLKLRATNEVHSVKDSQVLNTSSRSQDILMWDLKVTLAKNAAANLSEEVRKGQLEKLTQGWLPKEPPMGYKTVITEGKHLHEIDDEKAPLIVKAFEMYASPDGTIEAVAQRVAKLGLKSLRGKPVNKNAIDRMLDNKFYVGINVWNGTEAAGKQTPIIDEALWEAVQQKKHGLEPKAKYKKHAALLRGFVHCVSCNRMIVWQLQKGRYYGRCNSYGGCRPAKYAREEDTEAYLLDVIRHTTTKNPEIYAWLRDSLTDYIKEKRSITIADRSLLEKQIAVQQGKLEVLYEDRLEEIITLSDYQQRSKRIKLTIAELEEELSKLNKSSEYVSDKAVRIVSLCTQAEECYTSKKSTNELKREIIDFYFGSITWNGHSLHTELSELAQLVISLGESIANGNKKVEPKSDQSDVAANEPSYPAWQGHVESNHDLRFWRPLY